MVFSFVNNRVLYFEGLFLCLCVEDGNRFICVLFMCVYVCLSGYGYEEGWCKGSDHDDSVFASLVHHPI